ncbi:MAG TPA: thioredoxin [Anaerolineae bacterium]|nr:thioredoxin [Anaerolineae bacterium]
MTSETIIDVNELNFEYEVLAYSQNVPVIVDFWAEWCHPCKILTPLLEKIVLETNGSVRLAKVNIDQNPNLAMQYGVRSIPTVKAFTQREVAAEFVGVQPEERIHQFVKKLAPPSPVDLSITKADNLLLTYDWLEAESIYRQALQDKPDSPAGLLGLAKALLAQAHAQEALEIFHEFPPSKEYTQAQTLLPLAKSLDKLNKDELPKESDLDAAFRNSIRLAGQGNLPSALDGTLDILRQDKNYCQKLAHKVALSLLEMMGEQNELTRQYRSELASVLF